MLMRATAHAVAFRFPVHKNARFHGCEWKREQLAARKTAIFLDELRDICYICVI